MAKYKKKPVIIEAWQFTKENLKKGVPHWFKHFDRKVELWSQYGGNSIRGEIETLEGIYEVPYEKVNGENPKVITKETSLGVIVESLIEGANSFLMTCPSCDKPITSSQQAYIHDGHDGIKREWYCRNCGQKLNNHSIIPSSNK